MKLFPILLENIDIGYISNSDGFVKKIDELDTALTKKEGYVYKNLTPTAITGRSFINQLDEFTKTYGVIVNGKLKFCLVCHK